MQHDRRRSPHTVRAYVATAHRFVDFLGRYRGEQIGRFALLALNATDLRAFLADRRGSGLGASSAARELSAVRAFLNYAADQEGQAAQLLVRCATLNRMTHLGMPDSYAVAA